MDWHSRDVLAWEISTTLDTIFCLESLNQALEISKPGIFNTDQGSQFTSLEFTGWPAGSAWMAEDEYSTISLNPLTTDNGASFIDRSSL